MEKSSIQYLPLKIFSPPNKLIKHIYRKRKLLFTLQCWLRKHRYFTKITPSTVNYRWIKPTVINHLWVVIFHRNFHSAQQNKFFGWVVDYFLTSQFSCPIVLGLTPSPQPTMLLCCIVLHLFNHSLQSPWSFSMFDENRLWFNTL